MTPFAQPVVERQIGCEEMFVEWVAIDHSAAPSAVNIQPSQKPHFGGKSRLSGKATPRQGRLKRTLHLGPGEPEMPLVLTQRHLVVLPRPTGGTVPVATKVKVINGGCRSVCAP